MAFLVRLTLLPRRFKILLMVLTDLFLLPIALWSAVALRLGTVQPVVIEYWWLFFALPMISVPIFRKVGLYRAVIRFLDEKLLITVLYGVTLSTLTLVVLVALARVNTLPRSSIAIYWLFAIAYIGATRILARGVIRRVESRLDKKKKVAIYGAGRAGTQVAFALVNSREFQPVAFFDDNDEKQGMFIGGLKVFSPEEFEKALVTYEIDEMILAIPSSGRNRRKEIIEGLRKYNIPLRTIPGIAEIVDGRVRIEDIREVGIEDLLGRDQVPPDETLLRKSVFDLSVCVTGAGGSIGSELCRQISKLNPKRLLIVDNSEFALYSIERELKDLFPRLDLIPILLDVCDEKKMEILFHENSVKTVFHAAAYKHVPLVETNPGAGILNNSFGTLAAGKAAISAGVERFILISTDKAVRPTNVMGASKRLAELILQALSSEKSKTIFSMVRFGNVLGSSGSVVPLFKQQIEKGGPITVTHPDIIRYFMTIPEASQLVIQAGAMASGGEVFLLDMGEPVKICDLAKRMVELSGLTIKDSKNPNGDIEIVFTGLRPGEKLYEELLIGGSSIRTSHPSILKAQEHMIPKDQLFEMLIPLSEGCRKWDSDSLKTYLAKIVCEYKAQADSSVQKLNS